MTKLGIAICVFAGLSPLATAWRASSARPGSVLPAMLPRPASTAVQVPACKFPDTVICFGDCISIKCTASTSGFHSCSITLHACHSEGQVAICSDVVVSNPCD